MCEWKIDFSNAVCTWTYCIAITFHLKHNTGAWEYFCLKLGGWYFSRLRPGTKFAFIGVLCLVPLTPQQTAFRLTAPPTLCLYDITPEADNTLHLRTKGGLHHLDLRHVESLSAGACIPRWRCKWQAGVTLLTAALHEYLTVRTCQILHVIPPELYDAFYLLVCQLLKLN